MRNFTMRNQTLRIFRPIPIFRRFRTTGRPWARIGDRAQVGRLRDRWLISVAGSFLGHRELKFGSSWLYQYTGTAEPLGVGGNYQLVFRTASGVPGTPYEIRVYNYPVTNIQENLNEGGFYGEDTWQIGKRLTVNIGLRFDDFCYVGSSPIEGGGNFWFSHASLMGSPGRRHGVSLPAHAGNIWTGAAQSFPYIDSGAYRNVAPRIGGAWDVFGNNKTVLKASYGRYNETPGDDYAAAYNSNSATITTFAWNPTVTTCTESVAATGGCNYVPGSVNLNPTGPAYITTTGGSNGGAAALANTALNPGLKEQYVNEYQVLLEREIGPGTSARLGFTYVDNPDEWAQIPIPTGPNSVPYSAWTGGTAYTVYDAGPFG